MPSLLKDRVAIITGAGRGGSLVLGRASPSKKASRRRLSGIPQRSCLNLRNQQDKPNNQMNHMNQINQTNQILAFLAFRAC